MVGLIDIDSKIPNLALMKISNYYKVLGEEVKFVQTGIKYEKIFASAIFTKSKNECERLLDRYGDIIEIRWTGWELNKVLPDAIEHIKPDYNSYTVDEIAKPKRMRGIMSKERKLKKATEIVNVGMGFTSTGCIREFG